jgi:hypothetical protein
MAMARKPSNPHHEGGLDQPAMRVVLPAKTAHDPSQAHTRGTRPSTVTNAIRFGQQLAEALRAARTLMDRTPTDFQALVEQLRRWYYTQHPAERDRLLWQRFTGAEQIYGRLESAVGVAREALEIERLALVQAEAERSASRPILSAHGRRSSHRHATPWDATRSSDQRQLGGPPSPA